MTAVLVVGAIAVVGAVVARVTWRRPGDERHSIQSHQQTLETLRSMADRRTGGLRDPAPGPGPDSGGSAAPRTARARADASPSRSQAPARPGQVRAGSARAPTSPTSNGHGPDELVFVDDAAGAAGRRSDESPRSSTLQLSRGLPRARGGYRRSWAPRGRSRTRLLPVVGAAVVLAVVVVVALALAPSHPTTTAQHGSSPPRKTLTHRTHSHTTVTAPPDVRPTAATAVSATYGVPASGYTVELQATGPCWVEATATATGDVVWTGTLVSGQSRSIPATGSLLLRLGAADDVSVTLNGEPVIMPVGFNSPFDMSFDST